MEEILKGKTVLVVDDTTVARMLAHFSELLAILDHDDPEYAS